MSSVIEQSPVAGKDSFLRVCLLAPWYGGSHRRWADEYKSHSRHRIDILSMPARHWKWRMHGAAVTLAEQYLRMGVEYDLILAEDMMDVAVFTAIIRSRKISIPIVTYFHENQLTYPLSPRDTDIREKRELHYGYLNYTSALVSDRIYFNSHYHRESFLGGLPTFLNRYPDHRNQATVEEIRAKSEVLHLGMDLERLDTCRPDWTPHSDPLILWNHRREHDKCPEEFLGILYQLLEMGVSFKVVLLGKQSQSTKDLFAEAYSRLGERILHDGLVRDSREYAEWLWKSDILPVTSRQDFFGGSVVEAVYCNCHPVLPRRLAYPEHFQGRNVFYDTRKEAVEAILKLIQSGEWAQPSALREDSAQYSWKRLTPVYDASLSRLCHPHW